MNTSPHDYERLAKPLYHWAQLARFQDKGPLLDGVHVIQLEGGRHLDLLVDGTVDALPPGRALPVFFSAAIGDRGEKSPPYFAGSGIGRRLGVPTISVSDPLLEDPAGLSIGWHTGGAHAGTQEAITKLLRTVSWGSGRELLLIGGSAGGFAALLYADRLGERASAFVWNPQTDILDYAPLAVDSFLRTALPHADLPDRADDDWRTAAKTALDTGGIQHSVRHVSSVRGPRRLLYLQNAGDWHLGVHTAPFVDERGYEVLGAGTFGHTDLRRVVVSRLADGHNAPAGDLLARTVELLLDTSLGPAKALAVLRAEDLLPAQRLDSLPTDLRSETGTLRKQLLVSATRAPDGRVEAWVALDDLPRRYGGLQVTFTFQGHKEPTLRASAALRVALEDRNAHYTEVELDVRDGFGHALFTLTEPIRNAEHPPRQPADPSPSPGIVESDMASRAPEVTLTVAGQRELVATMFAPDATHYSFHLYRGSQRIELTPYRQAPSWTFHVEAPGTYACRAFAMTRARERRPVSSVPVEVT